MMQITTDLQYDEVSETYHTLNFEILNEPGFDLRLIIDIEFQKEL